MSEKLEELQIYMTWACTYVLCSDENNLESRVSKIRATLYSAYEDCKISTSETVLAIHTIYTAKILREEMLKI